MPREKMHTIGGALGEGEENRDRLLAYLAKSDFAQDITHKILTEGYAVIPNVLSPEECHIELDRMWGFIEKIEPSIKRHKPASWRAQPGNDPWPCAQRDMFQLFQAGWVFSDLRERIAERVFEPLYGTRQLHTSKDGFTMQRPTLGGAKRSPNDHFDQGTLFKGLHCIQGSFALTDQEYEDGCFQVWPGSHRLHEQVLYPGQTSDFNIMDHSQRQMLHDAGIHPIRVPVPRGTCILWRSDLVHCGAPPIGDRSNFRAAVYICCLPASLTPAEVLKDKAAAFRELKTGSHWPSREEWFKERRGVHKKQQPYFTSPPQLTHRQKELYGLVQYDPKEAAAEAAAADAAADAAAEAQAAAERQAVEAVQAAELNKLRRKVRDVEQLEARRVRGEQLQPNQLTKLAKATEFRAELAAHLASRPTTVAESSAAALAAPSEAAAVISTPTVVTRQSSGTKRPTADDDAARQPATSEDATQPLTEESSAQARRMARGRRRGGRSGHQRLQDKAWADA